MDDDVATEADLHPEMDAAPEDSASGFGAVKFIMLLCGILLYGYTLYTVLSAMIFPASVKPFLGTEMPQSNSSNATIQGDSCWAQLTVDALLLLLFFLQHTSMANTSLKALLGKAITPALQRPLYIFTSCLALQVIYSFWRPTPSFTLWQTAPGSSVLNVLLVSVQALSWVSIACSLFFTDYLELMGIKQLYYSLHGMGDPMQRKAEEQRRLLEHMRHPVFFGPALILWAVPVMTYDRLLMAIMVPLYLGWGSHLDQLDAAYVREQFGKKRHEIFDVDKAD